jgi:hypothetical protein
MDFCGYFSLRKTRAFGPRTGVFRLHKRKPKTRKQPDPRADIALFREGKPGVVLEQTTRERGDPAIPA